MISVVKKYASLVVTFGAFGSVFGVSSFGGDQIISALAVQTPPAPIEGLRELAMKRLQDAQKKQQEIEAIILPELSQLTFFPQDKSRGMLSSMTTFLACVSKEAGLAVEKCNEVVAILRSATSSVELAATDLFAKEASSLAKITSTNALFGELQTRIARLNGQIERLGAALGSRPCIVCSKTEKEDGVTISSCSRCKKAFYCSEVCQRAHWNEHKKVCASAKK